jgi:hypothetical protein
VQLEPPFEPLSGSIELCCRARDRCGAKGYACDDRPAWYCEACWEASR